MVARSASARLQLVGHLGWVHQHEARPVGEPRERMGGRRERRTTGRDRLVWHEKTRRQGGGVSLGTLDFTTHSVAQHWARDWRALALTQAKNFTTKLPRAQHWARDWRALALTQAKKFLASCKQRIEKGRL